MKEDQSKFSMACNNVQQNTNLEELTMLALKITEEIKRAQMNTGAATNTDDWMNYVQWTTLLFEKHTNFINSSIPATARCISNAPTPLSSVLK